VRDAAVRVRLGVDLDALQVVLAWLDTVVPPVRVGAARWELGGEVWWWMQETRNAFACGCRWRADSRRNCRHPFTRGRLGPEGTLHPFWLS
jgi:hypothetical protein